MNTTYLLLEVRRIVRDVPALFFIVALPCFLYLIFGATQDYADEPLLHGNVALYITVGMAAYGAVTATSSIGGMAAVERAQGWGRQLGLTPMRDWQFILVKTQVAVLLALIPVVGVYALGNATGAEGSATAWAVSALAVVAGAVTFSLYGLVIGLAFGSESAVNAASGMLVILAFLGNLFFPLSGTLLEIGRFTPLYGYAGLVRYPVNGGNGSSSPMEAGREPDSLLWLLGNLGFWTLALGLLAVWLVRRGRPRQ
jgi:ABC-2 type transport system permease protein